MVEEGSAEVGVDGLERGRRVLESLRRGEFHSERYEYEEAAGAYREALASDGRCIAARVKLANTLFRLGRLKEAEGEFEKCLGQNPQEKTALFNLAQTQMSLGEHSRAARTLGRLLAQDDKDGQGWLMHGDVLAELGATEEAVRSWERAADEFSPVRRAALGRLRQYRP